MRAKLPVLAALLLVALAAAALWLRLPSAGPADPLPRAADYPPGPVRQVVELLVGGGPAARLEPPPEGPVYLALRASGKPLAETWSEGPGYRMAVAEGLSELARTRPQAVAQADALAVCLPYDYRAV